MIPVQEELPFREPTMPTWGGMYSPPVPVTESEQDEAVRAALNAVEQVKHEVDENDYLGAIQNLMKIRAMMVRAQERGYPSAWHSIQSAFTRALEMIEQTWPGKIRGIR